MKPSFASVRANFYPATKILRAPLFEEIGWSDLTDNEAYKDTCAIRISLALIKCGMTIPGRIPIKAGEHKGKLIEPGQAKLSNILARPHFFGAPEKFTTANAQAGIGARPVVISFFDVDPAAQSRQGHIDIVEFGGGYRVCGSSCFWSSQAIWFWPL